MVLRQDSGQRRPETAQPASVRHGDDRKRRQGTVRSKRFAGGRQLDPPTRDLMGSRFGVDFSSVRVHSGERAASLARSEGAAAFAVGEDIVFGDARYDTATPSGRRLLAHELAHVVQQRRGEGASGVEARASAAAEIVALGGSVSAGALGGAPFGIHRDNGEEEKKKPPSTKPAPKPAPKAAPDPSGAAAGGARFKLPKIKLTPPSLLQSRPDLTSSLAGTLAPPGSLGPQPGAAPKMPSRLPIYSSGQFSLGLRLGFPKPELLVDPDAPPSAAAESLKRAEIMNQTLTGKVPSGWESLDKGKLASAVWGIFSTYIAPDFAKKITSGLSTPIGSSGVSAELDLVLITDFGKEIGGGLSFTLRTPL